MRHRKLADRYAGGLFAALPDDTDRAGAFRALEYLSDLYRHHHYFHSAISNPAIPRKERCALVDALLEQETAGAPVHRLIHLLIDRSRAHLIPAVAEVFGQLLDESRGAVRAVLRSAAPLNEDERARVRAALEKRTGKTVRIECIVDDELIGGVIADVSGVRYDGSIRTQLNRLREALLAEEH